VVAVTKGTKKLLSGIVIALLLYYLFTQPTDAANAVSGLFDLLQQAAEAFIVFLRNVF
jgi:hypothetical protein